MRSPSALDDPTRLPLHGRERWWRTPLRAIALAAALLTNLPASAAPRGEPSSAAGSIDRSATRRVYRLVRDLADRAERATLRRRPESTDALRAWLLPRLAEIGVDPETLAKRALDRHSQLADADAVVRLTLAGLSPDAPEVDPANVPSILRSRPEYPANPAAAADLIRRLADAPAIATLPPRRAPSLAERLLELDDARAEVEPRRGEV